jgi:hypothetical protein
MISSEKVLTSSPVHILTLRGLLYILCSTVHFLFHYSTNILCSSSEPPRDRPKVACLYVTTRVTLHSLPAVELTSSPSFVITMPPMSIVPLGDHFAAG